MNHPNFWAKTFKALCKKLCNQYFDLYLLDLMWISFLYLDLKIFLRDRERGGGGYGFIFYCVNKLIFMEHCLYCKANLRIFHLFLKILVLIKKNK